jgi:transglutaminase-like putative cysteine protease
MKFSVACNLLYEVAEPTTLLVNLQAARFGRQTVLEERLDIPAGCRCDEYEMPAEHNRVVRLTLAPGQAPITYRATVELAAVTGAPGSISEIGIDVMPLSVTPYLLQSRYCQSDRLARFAEVEFGGAAPGFDRVTAICNWIYRHLAYTSGSSNPLTTAVDTLVARQGVCRDFAHLGVALCRAIGVPARFVSAYAWMLEPPDFHALFEVYLSGRWWMFDATRKSSVDGIVRIGSGRDAADVAFASIFGNATLTDMAVSIIPAEAMAMPGEPTTQPISLSDT